MRNIGTADWANLTNGDEEPKITQMGTDVGIQSQFAQFVQFAVRFTVPHQSALHPFTSASTFRPTAQPPNRFTGNPHVSLICRMYCGLYSL